MTATPIRPDEAMTLAGIPVRQVRSARRAGIASSALALVIIALTLAAGQFFAQRVTSQIGRDTYALTGPLAGSVAGSAASNQQWLQADTSAAVGWFRLDPTLASQPKSAVLWVDATDQFQVWVNGYRVLNNRTSSRSGADPQAMSIDVANILRRGSNVIAVQAVSLAQGAPKLWLRLATRSDNGQSQVFDTASPQWKATADTAVVGATLAAQPKFVDADFSVASWHSAVLTGSARNPASAVAPAVLETALTAQPVSPVSRVATDAVFATTLDLPAATDDVWLRLAATGGASVLLNGQQITTLPDPGYVSPTSHRTAAMLVVHVGSGSRVAAGHLSVHTTGSRPAVLVLDALVRTHGSWQKLDVAPAAWSVTSLTASQSAGQPAASASPGQPAALASVWPHGFTRTSVSANPAPIPVRHIGLLVLAVLAGLLLLLSVIGRAFGGSVNRWLWRITVCAAIPTAALTLVLWTYSPWQAWLGEVSTSARWGYLLPAIFAVLAVLCLLAEAAGRSGVLHRRTGSSLPDQVPGPLPDPLAGPLTGPQAGPLPDREAGPLPARRIPFAVLVAGIAVLGVFVMGWRLWRQPLWQDEATSIEVSRAINRHGLPRLASGLLYFKAELYHGLLALVLDVTGDVSILRLISLLWFGATIAVFGLLFMPTIAPGRRGVQLLATLAMIVVPAEQVWARDVRMYQQMQFFSVLFIALFVRALTLRDRRYTRLSALALLAMYFSHEESFVLLPALVVAAALCWRTTWQLRATVLRWYGPALVLIGVQYLASGIHPPNFGDDLSNRSYVGWDPHQAGFYYQQVFFAPLTGSGSLAIVSTLALLGLVGAVRQRALAARIVGLLAVLTIISTSLFFTAKVSRYSFAVIPMVIGMAALGGYYLMSWLVQWVKPRVGFQTTSSQYFQGVMAVLAGLLMLLTVGTLGRSPAAFGLLAADVSSAPSPYSHPDYQQSIDYLKDHERPGDTVITLSPPALTRQYLGRSPDRIIQTGRNKLLYIVYRNGVATDTILGSPVILNGDDLRRYLQEHSRVWLVSDTGSLVQGVPVDLRSEISADFSMVFQNAGTSVSLRNAG